jgi:hypothetical protein
MAKDDLEARTVFAGSEEASLTQPEEGGTIPEDQPLVERTGYAQEGVRIAVLFAHRFGKRILGTRGHLAIKLNEPGVSTDAGVKARQAFVLVPRSKGRGSTTIGWIDIPRGLAELKTFPLLADQHRSRKGDEIDVGKDEYEVLINDLQDFLRSNQVTPTLAEPPSALAKAVPKTKGGLEMTPRTIAAIIAIILAIGIAIGLGVARGCGSQDTEEARFDADEELQPQPSSLKRRGLPSRPR